MSDNNNTPKRLKRAEEKPMSDNNTPKKKYDVFVSFRGREIRKGFLSYLIKDFERKKINAFVDNKLEKGEKIWPSLEQAIERSSISLIIFSPDYASSHWCLDELVTILECRNKYGQTIIPVFYKVKPTDVGHQSSESYKDAFAEHEIKYNETKVQKWRDALKETAKMSGIVSSNRTDAGIVEEIVNLVLTKLPKRYVKSKGLVGIDKKVADVELLIHKESENTRLIGIWGMGGIGKTTLAEEVFNKLRYEYEGAKLVLNERDQSKKGGIISLRREIFSELLGNDVKFDTLNSLPGDIDRRIGHMKVLIVLDDVYDSSHIIKLLGTLDKFGSGSTIIVTARDKHVLDANNADSIFQVRDLSSDEALELFNLNAFNQIDHQKEYNELSKRMVHYAKGSPLVVTVLARRLHGKNKEIWESELHKLNTMPPTKVYHVMKLSYDDLDRKEQLIFLDLACFLLKLHRMVKVDNIKSLLKDEKDDSVVVMLERLKDKALITFSEDNFITMHDILQDMGREIESSKDPSRRRWLWDPQDICEAMENDKGTKAIRSMEIDLTKVKEKIKLRPDMLSKMSGLKFLEIYNGSNQHNILAEGLQLRFLSWHSSPLTSLPENFFAEKLVILKLRGGNLEKLWNGVKNLVNLKELDLSQSEKLKELPDLSKATNLEVILLFACSQLISVHPSIFSLAKLEKLDLWNCRSLTRLTSDSPLCNLSYLNLDGCKNLQEFSVIFKNMKDLRLPGTKIQECPSSFGHQRKLESQHIEGSVIKRLTLSFNNLTRQLQHLKVCNCRNLQTISELPPFLENLDVVDCKSLETILKLPLSLKTLNVKECDSFQSLPEFPSSLKTLNVKKCKSLKSLLEPPSGPSLKTLNVEECDSLQSLLEFPSSLETLNVKNCMSLKSLPEFPSSLETLNVKNCMSLKSLPEFPSSLETLNVKNCMSLKSLLEPPSGPSLKTLNVEGCYSLQSLLEFPSSLETLNVKNCMSLKSLPEFPSSLETLNVKNCMSLKSLLEPPSGPSLKTLNVEECDSLQSLLQFPSSLETLNIKNCWSLKSLPEPPPSSSLKILNVDFCGKLKNIPNLPESLETLRVSYCYSLETLPELPRSLKTLSYSGYPKIRRKLPELPPFLNTLSIKSGEFLESLPDLPPFLKTLNVMSCELLQSLPELPSSLETLNVQGCSSLQALPQLPLLLKTINANTCKSLKSILFPSTVVEQLEENRTQLLLGNCLNLDEHCLEPIGLNAQINVMKFANQNLSTQNHDHVDKYNDYVDNYCSYQAVYMYPGSSVPEWLEYKTTKDCIIIDHHYDPASPLGFIFCFNIGMHQVQWKTMERVEVNITINNGEDEAKKDNVKMYMNLCDQKIESEHVCVIYDQRCSAFLNIKAGNQTGFEIRVNMSVLFYYGETYTPAQHILKGFGVSPISTSTYNSFIQQMKLRDSM